MVLNSGAGLLQADATRRARRRRPLVAQPLYLSGLVVDGLGWTCTIVALRYLPVFAVQAVLGGAIALTALAARKLLRSVQRAVDRIAIGACVLGLILAAPLTSAVVRISADLARARAEAEPGEAAPPSGEPVPQASGP